MPCIAIHLAIAKKYLEKHNENKEEFILGTLAPDFSMENTNKFIKVNDVNKNSRHFGSNFHPTSLKEYMKGKTSFKLFFNDNDLTNSFIKGYFLHLLSDYYFFDMCINDERLDGLSLQDGVKIGYNDYDLITEILINKYNLDIPEIAKDIMSRKGYGKLQILDENRVDIFINNMSNLDLSKEKIKMLKKEE